MASRASERGAAVGLPVDGLPDGVMHYQSGPVAFRPFRFGGRDWLGEFEAEHDGTGWLVVRSRFRPLLMMPGDHLHVRVTMIEDHGDQVLVAIDGPRGREVRSIPRSAIVFIEEAAAAADPAARALSP